MKVSTRTVQRWLKDEILIPVKVVAMQADGDISPVRKNVPDCPRLSRV